MITLYTFGPGFGLPDPSPFVVKAEMLLKLAGLPYQINRKDGMRKAPKGKLPFIEDDGQIIADSTFIRWHLEKKYGIDFDKGLSDSEKATGWALEKTLEEHLYWCVLDTRWGDDANFAKGPAIFFNKVPLPLRGLIKAMIRRQIRKNLKAHGMGRHARPDIESLGMKDIDAVAAILGDKPYLLGSSPSGYDASVFAFMGSMLCPIFETPMRTHAETKANLVAYVARMRAQFYPDL